VVALALCDVVQQAGGHEIVNTKWRPPVAGRHSLVFYRRLVGGRCAVVAGSGRS
jgi:hypothetical protein